MWLFIGIVSLPLILLAAVALLSAASDFAALKDEWGGGDADDVDEAPAVSTCTKNGNFVIHNEWLEGGRYGHDGKYDDNYDRGWDTDGYPI